MNYTDEIELIKRFIEASGKRVQDINWFREYLNVAGAVGIDIGVQGGYLAQHQYFFGHISILHEYSGVINVANQNETDYHFSTLLYGGLETSDVRFPFAVNLNMSLLGNGYYKGAKRLYGVGCNRVSIVTIGIGAAVIAGEIGFDGLMFTVI